MKKRSAIIALVVLFVCVAVYINWNYGENNPTEDVISDSTVVSEMMENGAVIVSKTDENVQTETAVYTKNEDAYFASARLARQQARDSAMNILRETMSTETATSASLETATTAMEKLAADAMSEARTETLIKAKGFEDCVVLIGDDGCVDVVVKSPEGGLVGSDVTKIRDAVMGETGVSAENITVIEVE